MQQQVQPTTVTPTPQSDLMAWRVGVICSEREEMLLKIIVLVVRVWWGHIETLWSVALNCGTKPKFILFVHVYIYFSTLYLIHSPDEL
jgi:hypothetical protein